MICGGDIEGDEPTFCRECAAPLIAEDAHFYESRCEKCEAEWAHAISAWRRGDEVDPEDAQRFDAQFSQPKTPKKPTTH